MTTLVPFLPTQGDPPFTAQVTMDGLPCTIVAAWNLWQRWYITLYDASGNLVFNQPLVASPPPLSLASITWASTGVGGIVTAAAASPLALTPGLLVYYTIAGCSPDGYNGTYLCAVESPTTFTYSVAADPGLATTAGTFSPDIDLAARYFTSTLVWRPSTGYIEVNP